MLSEGFIPMLISSSIAFLNADTRSFAASPKVPSTDASTCFKSMFKALNMSATVLTL